MSARRILTARRYGGLSFEDLKKLGVVLRRAAFFITCRGAFLPQVRLNPETMRQVLLRDSRPYLGALHHQLSFFDPPEAQKAPLFMLKGS